MPPTAICSLGISVAVLNALQQCSCIVIPILPRTSDIDAQYTTKVLITCGVVAERLVAVALAAELGVDIGGEDLTDSRPPTGRNSGYFL